MVARGTLLLEVIKLSPCKKLAYIPQDTSKHHTQLSRPLLRVLNRFPTNKHSQLDSE
jgi:hypothetical protein